MSLPRPGFDAGEIVQAGKTAEFADKGRVIVRTAAEAKPGQGVLYNIETGEIAGGNPGTLPAGTAAIPDALFVFVAAPAGGLAVVQMG
jgi:hypothetical protein